MKIKQAWDVDGAAVLSIPIVASPSVLSKGEGKHRTLSPQGTTSPTPSRVAGLWYPVNGEQKLTSTSHGWISTAFQAGKPSEAPPSDFGERGPRPSRGALNCFSLFKRLV